MAFYGLFISAPCSKEEYHWKEFQTFLSQFFHDVDTVETICYRILIKKKKKNEDDKPVLNESHIVEGVSPQN